MKNKIIDVKRVINENEDELRLKKYISKIVNIYGEEYAAIILTSDKDMDKSLKLFSSKFKSLNSTNIKSILFQSAILSERNIYKGVFNKRTDKDFWFEEFFKIDRDILLKKFYIREFIKDCNKSNMYLFNNLKNKEEQEKAIYNLYQLKRFEKSISAQEEHQRRRILRKKKKGKF